MYDALLAAKYSERWPFILTHEKGPTIHCIIIKKSKIWPAHMKMSNSKLSMGWF